MRVDVTIADLAQEPIAASREHLDPERVAFYADHPDRAAPVTVFDIGGRLLLADGYHRVAAAERLGHTTIPAEVRRGTRSDALAYAVDLARRQRGLSEQQVLAAINRRAQRADPGH